MTYGNMSILICIFFKPRSYLGKGLLAVACNMFYFVRECYPFTPLTDLCIFSKCRNDTEDYKRRSSTEEGENIVKRRPRNGLGH